MKFSGSGGGVGGGGVALCLSLQCDTHKCIFIFIHTNDWRPSFALRFILFLFSFLSLFPLLFVSVYLLFSVLNERKRRDEFNSGDGAIRPRPFVPQLNISSVLHHSARRILCINSLFFCGREFAHFMNRNAESRRREYLCWWLVANNKTKTRINGESRIVY